MRDLDARTYCRRFQSCNSTVAIWGQSIGHGSTFPGHWISVYARTVSTPRGAHSPCCLLGRRGTHSLLGEQRHTGDRLHRRFWGLCLLKTSNHRFGGACTSLRRQTTDLGGLYLLRTSVCDHLDVIRTAWSPLLLLAAILWICFCSVGSLCQRLQDDYGSDRSENCCAHGL